MAEVSVAGGASGSVTTLSVDTLFAVEDGAIEFSTDAGTTYILFNAGEKIIFSSGSTVAYRNPRPALAAFAHMAV